ncbi:hypothetical protein FACS1894179_02450 [Bacteroidia bacterium]|nr:hypothetical protein FACS1894179_02450 [Bacteroidia bacterium]
MSAGKNKIYIASEKFKTVEGIGINSTIEDFAEKYPDYSIYWSYIDDISLLQDGVELKLSDFKKETKITAIIF